jgi:hypothetical protein
LDRNLFEIQQVYEMKCGKMTPSLYRPRYTPEVLKRLRLPRFSDKVVRLSALGTGCLYPTGKIPDTLFC